MKKQSYVVIGYREVLQSKRNEPMKMLYGTHINKGKDYKDKGWQDTTDVKSATTPKTTAAE